MVNSLRAFVAISLGTAHAANLLHVGERGHQQRRPNLAPFPDPPQISSHVASFLEWDAVRPQGTLSQVSKSTEQDVHVFLETGGRAAANALKSDVVHSNLAVRANAVKIRFGIAQKLAGRGEDNCDLWRDVLQELGSLLESEKEKEARLHLRAGRIPPSLDLNALLAAPLEPLDLDMDFVPGYGSRCSRNPRGGREKSISSRKITSSVEPVLRHESTQARIREWAIGAMVRATLVSEQKDSSTEESFCSETSDTVVDMLLEVGIGNKDPYAQLAAVVALGKVDLKKLGETRLQGVVSKLGQLARQGHYVGDWIADYRIEALDVLSRIARWRSGSSEFCLSGKGVSLSSAAATGILDSAMSSNVDGLLQSKAMDSLVQIVTAESVSDAEALKVEFVLEIFFCSAGVVTHWE